MFAIGANKAVLAQRNGDGSIHIYVALRTDEDPSHSRGSAAPDEEMMLAELHAFLDGWSPEIHGILDQADGGFSYWPLHTVPTHQEWSPHRGLTLVGDAAHVMPPFTGQGVNMALLDALELVDALTGRPSDIDGAIASYEAAMLERMAGVVAEANAAGDHLLSADGRPLSCPTSAPPRERVRGLVRGSGLYRRRRWWRFTGALALHDRSEIRVSAPWRADRRISRRSWAC